MVSPSPPSRHLAMSATKAEIFIPEAQLPIYRAVLQVFVLMDPSPLTEMDLRRRAAAYRNSYYRAYWQATLRAGLPPRQALAVTDEFDLLVHIQTRRTHTRPPLSHDVQGRF